MAFPSSLGPQSGTHDAQDAFREDMNVLNEESSDVKAPGQEGDEELDKDLEDLEEDADKDDEKVEGDEEKKEDEEEELDEDGKPIKKEKEKEDDEDKEGEKAEDKTPVGHDRPTVPQIKAKYPNFFRDFPEMRHMLFREQRYAEIYPTVDDAQEAHERAESYDTFSNLLASGDPKDFTEFLQGVEKAGGEALTSMAANFLPSLYAVDRDMYYSVTSPIAETILQRAYKAGKSTGNKNLENAALQLSNYIFQDTGFATGEKRSEPIKQAPVRDAAFEQEKQEFYTAKLNEIRTSVGSNAETKLRAEIRKGLDPNGAFNQFTQNLLVDRILSEVGKELEKDARHMGAMNSLWRHAHKANYIGNWKDRLLSTYLSGARPIMIQVRSRIRQKAMADEQQRTERRREDANRGSERKEPTSGAPGNKQKAAGNSNKTPKSSEIDWGRTSDLDILNDRPTLKK